MSFLSRSMRILSPLFLLSPAIAQPIDINPLIAELPQGTAVSVLAKNLDKNEIILTHNPTTFMLPASTQKIFTALASKLVLPDNFTFQTALLHTGHIQNGSLKGDLIARFTGDPSLTSGQFYQLISKLKKQGIQRIDGNIQLDTTVFSSHDKGLGWVWNDLSTCFSAPAAAVNIDGNCFYVDLDANKDVGSLIEVKVPSAYPVIVESSAYIADKYEAGYCQLDAVIVGRNHFQIQGCLTRQEKPFGLSFAVQDPSAFGAALLVKYLKQVGIEFSGKILQPVKVPEGTLLAEHHSKPLTDLLKKMMKKSDNQIADSLFRTIAHKYHQRAASFPLASQTLRQLLRSKGGIQFGHSVISDGSGLSRYNQVSSETMLQTLEVIAQNEEVLHLFDTFPIAAVDGTISGRSSIAHEPLTNNMIAKTGALKGVYNLAGFMKNARGERIAFVQFINGYATGEMEAKTKRAPLNKFEKALYMAIFNH